MLLPDVIEALPPPVDFLAVWAAAYVGHVALYLAFGAAIGWALALRPNKRIAMLSGRKRRSDRTAAAEIKLSLKAMVATSVCLAGALYAQGKGWTQTPLELTPVSAVWTFLATMVLHDMWFYFGHRLMHTRLLYPYHKPHHANAAPIQWTANSFSPLDAFVVQSGFLVLPFVIPIPPLVLVAYIFFDQAKGVIGHSGYEYFAGRMARAPWPFIATIHHDLHHQRFSVNFANQFTLLDRLFGTLDPDYDRLVREIENGRAPADLAEVARTRRKG